MRIRLHLKLATYLPGAHAAGRWQLAQRLDLCLLEARIGQVPPQHLTDARLPSELAAAAYDASEELRASPPFTQEWPLMQAQVTRIVPCQWCHTAKHRALKAGWAARRRPGAPALYYLSIVL